MQRLQRVLPRCETHMHHEELFHGKMFSLYGSCNLRDCLWNEIIAVLKLLEGIASV